MLELVRQSVPDVILLDHHWPEVGVEKVLSDLRRLAPSTRVVLYTGKRINPSSVIECARFGVAEYLPKGGVDVEALAKKLSMLAGDPSKTLEKLSAPSGIMQQLIQESEKTVIEAKTLREANRQLTLENASLRSGTRKEVYQALAKFFGATLYVCVSGALLFAAEQWTDGNYGVLAFCIFVALGGLVILDPTISQLVVKFGQSHFGVKRESDS
jgi:response regulator RpfG family c-di-GMP phosphodiesterase